MVIVVGNARCRRQSKKMYAGTYPLTALALKIGKAWLADQRFVKSIKRTVGEFGCNVILVTHPEKGIEDPSLLNISGGASYSRFSDAVITIKRHEEKA